MAQSYAVSYSKLMTPRDAITRLAELGPTLDIADLTNVRHLHISDEGTPKELAQVIWEMLPDTLTLNGTLMTLRDLPALQYFTSLQGIVAHRTDLAKELLRSFVHSEHLRSIAMAFTSITDAEVELLANHPGIRSIYLAGTRITDTAMRTFGTLRDLELLDVRETRVSNNGLTCLMSLRNLFTIDVRETAVTREGADHYRHLVASFLPNVDVII